MFFPLDLNYRVTGDWVPSDGKKTIDVPNVLGDVTPTADCRGRRFQDQRPGVEVDCIWAEIRRKGLFFVFSDLTARPILIPADDFSILIR